MIAHRRSTVAVGLWLALALSPAVTRAQSTAALQAAVADPGRPPADIAKDATVQPAAIVAASGIKPGDIVVDLVPGNGYYTRILSKLVGARGKVYPYVPIVGNAQTNRARERAALAAGERVASNPADLVLAIQNIQPEYANVTVLWQTLAGMGVPQQVDAVFCVDGYRPIRAKEVGDTDIAVVNTSVFAILKPGGTFFVVDDADISAVLRAEIVAAGFIVNGPPVAIGARSVQAFRKPQAATGDQRPKGDPIKSWYGNTFTLGTVTERNRTIFHHPDGTYQEFGINDMQSGYWFWAADGRNCMLHQYPVEQRGFVTCHLYPTIEGAKQVGDMWIEGGPNHLAPYRVGDARPATGQGNIVGLTRGYVYPNVAPAPRGQGPGRGGTP